MMKALQLLQTLAPKQILASEDHFTVLKPTMGKYVYTYVLVQRD